MSNKPIHKQISSIESMEKKLSIKKALLVKNALETSHSPVDIIKANEVLNVDKRTEQGQQKAYVVDPYEFQTFLGYKDKPFSVSYAMARRISYSAPIIRSVINTRIEQIASFCEPQESKYDSGFIIRKKKNLYNAGEEEKITKEDLIRIEKLTEFILNCGLSNDFGNDDFDTFMRKFINDSMTFDQGTFEIVHDRRGRPVEFLAVDAATIRLANPEEVDKYNNTKENKDVLGYEVSHVQIRDNMVCAKYYPWEMCFGVRNPTTNIYSNGYGVSEIEMMVQVITSMLYSDEYNRRFFQQGSAPKGFFKVKPGSSIGNDKLKQFKQQWQSMMSGVYNTHKTPILEGDIDWIDLQKNNRDMEFAHWQEYLIKLACAIFRIDPAEINFPLSGGSEQRAMFEGNNEARLKHSKDKGLMPMLKFVERRINKYIIQRIDPRFEFKFQGLGVETAKDELEDDIKMLSNFMTVDEIRVKRGLKPLGEDKGGDVVANSIIFQSQMQKQQAMQEQQQDDGQEEEQYGEEGEEEQNPFEKAFNDYLNKI